MSKPLIFNAQVYDVRVKRNGGRLQLDFGNDSIAVVQEIAAIAMTKDCNFTFAVVQLPTDLETGIPDHEPVDF